MDEFVLSHVFNRIDYDGSEVVYWRECVGDSEGYILYWPADNQHHHTYHYPPNIFGE